MTKKQLVEKATPIILKIIKMRSNSDTFSYFTVDDIAQEIWTICLEALDKYQTSKGGLEHYLSTCVCNRMKNLKRDKYFRVNMNSQDAQTRLNIVNPVDIGDNDILTKSKQPTPLEVMLTNERLQIIRQHLSHELRKTLDDVLNGVYISKRKLENLLLVVRKIALEIEDA